MAISKIPSAGFSGTEGITMIDQWRLNANTNNSTSADVTANWERNDRTGYGSIGTGLTESSGIFSFPSTGIYLIHIHARIQNGANDTSSNYQLKITTDNSTYVKASVIASGNGSGNAVISGSGNLFVFDVTNTTTHKFKLTTTSFSSGTFLVGNTDDQNTGVTVMKIGNT